MGTPLIPFSKVEESQTVPLKVAGTFQECLHWRWGQDWLVGVDPKQFWQRVEIHIQSLSKRKLSPASSLSQYGSSPTVLIAERNPVNFLAGFLAACAANCSIYLANPDWGMQEWQQVWQQCQPDWVLGEVGGGGGRREEGGERSQGFWKAALWQEVEASDREFAPLAGSIGIPTGGSSGQIKFVVHTWQTLIASVEGFRQHFQAAQINAYCVLPLYHVSGLMQAMRTFVSGGRLVVQPFKQLEAGERLALPRSQNFLSLVPTQLQRLLYQEAAFIPWLRQFQAVLLGGAPAWPALLERARAFNLPIALTYGMTETASQVATLLPEEFLAGMTGSGRALPHAQIEIRNERGDLLPVGQVGQIWIQSRSLALNLPPAPTPTLNPSCFCPDDVGYLDEQGYLYVVGRNSTKIITGGENVFPEEVEAVLRATGLVEDVCVVGVPDETWGQAVVAMYIPKLGVTPGHLKDAIAPLLAKYKQPKRWLAVAELPRNAQGKLDRKKVLQQL